VHNFDFANFMFGRPVKVSSGLTQLKDSTAIDTGAIWMEYESGHIMSNMWSWGMAEKINAFSGMDMIAPKGALIFARNFDASEFKDQYDPETEGIHLLKKEGGAVEPVIYKLNKMTVDQMRHFIDCVKNGTEPCVNGEDGLLALKAALAALQEETL
jgi:UDP-N-acetylglucosamine 3-dehydrogenase